MNYPKRLINGEHYVRVKDPVFKYELLRNVSVKTDITGLNIHTDYFRLTEDGTLTAKKKYRWDGASGPAIDTITVMRGSLFHDLLWQLIEEGYLDESHRHYSNKLFRDICIEDGMWRVRAYTFYYTVDYIGRPYIRLKKKVYGRT